MGKLGRLTEPTLVFVLPILGELQTVVGAGRLVAGVVLPRRVAALVLPLLSVELCIGKGGGGEQGPKTKDLSEVEDHYVVSMYVYIYVVYVSQIYL